MRLTRRSFLRMFPAAVLGASVGLPAARSAAAPAERNLPAGADISAAWRSAAHFLGETQSPDGAWRSTRYGFFRGGDALTPLVLLALSDASESHAETSPVVRGGRWLNAFTDTLARRSQPWLELRYPLFSASYAARYYARRRDRERARVWTRCILALQHTERLGWPSDDPRHGGWSDAPLPPERPASGEMPDMLNPNISATAFAAIALAEAGCAAQARAAEAFVARCQNWQTGAGEHFDDGGFFFALEDPARNKAGVAGRDAGGRQRYRSYGSATCDGLLALFAAGKTASDSRAAAALRWLRERAANFHHPGAWPADRADSARALLLYYAQAFAQVLGRVEEPWAVSARRSLARGLMETQGVDGSWFNPDAESCEDDPIVATAFAAHALACVGRSASGN